MRVIPWSLAIATAAWFGFLAQSAGRYWLLWALTGGAFGLVASTIVFGVSHAASMPFSHQAGLLDQLKTVVAAFLVIFIFGWVITLRLHRRPQEIWQRIKGTLLNKGP